MGPSAPDQQSLLQHARAAHREHRYDAAYHALLSAHQQEPLDLEDVHRLAEAAWWVGLMGECLRLTEDMHQQFLSSGRLDRAAAQALDLGGMLAMRGEPALASGWLGRARRLLEGLPPGPTHGLLSYLDLSVALAESRLVEAGHQADELRRLGEENDDADLMALGHLGAGLVELRRGRIDDAFALFDEAILRVVGGDVTPEWAGHVYCTVVSACLDVADLNRARQWSRAAHRWLEDFSAAAMFTGVCRAHDVQLLVAEGAWAAVEEQAAVVVRELADLNVEAVAEAEYQSGEAHRLRGDPAGAAACYDRAVALGRDPQPGHALLLLSGGDLGTAWVEVSDAVARGSPDPFRCARLLRAQVEIGLAGGHDEAAARAARRLRGIAEVFRTAGFLAWADQADGCLALADGRSTEAVTAFGRALGHYRRMRSWYDAAVVEGLLAEAHQRIGDPVGAREHHEAAESGMRRLGVPTTATAPVPAGGLTRREAEVLGRVATGLSNRDAAEALSISEATVRRHLANIYLKLGVRSRTAAAAWAHEHGLVPRVGS